MRSLLSDFSNFREDNSNLGFIEVEKQNKNDSDYNLIHFITLVQDYPAVVAWW